MIIKTRIFVTTLVFLFTSSVSKAQLVPFLKESKFGFCNLEGDLIIDVKFDYVTEFENNGFALVKRGSKWWFINDKGVEIKKIINLANSEKGFDEIDFIGGYYRFLLDDKIGIIDGQLNLLYEESLKKSDLNKRNHKSLSLSYNLFVRTGERIARISDNKIVPNIRHKSIRHRYVEEKDSLVLFYIESDSTMSIIDLDGKVCLETKQTKLLTHLIDSNLYLINYSDELFTVYDENFNTVIPTSSMESYSSPKYFEEMNSKHKIALSARALVTHSNLKCSYNEEFNKCVCIERNNRGAVYVNGKNILPINSESFNPRNGLVYYEKEDKFGLINLDGNHISSLSDKKFNTAPKNGLLTKENGNWVFLDLKGNRIDNKEYSFSDPYKIQENESQKFAFCKGYYPITPFIYDSIMWNLNSAHFLAKRGEEYFVVDTTGVEIKSFNYERIEPNGICYTTMKDGLYGLISNNGKYFCEPQYLELELYSKREELFEATTTNGETIIITSKATRLGLTVSDVEKGKLSPLKDNYYVFKKGRHYTFFNPEGSITFEISLSELPKRSWVNNIIYWPGQRSSLKFPGVVKYRDIFFNYHKGIIYMN